ncbi:MAG TPA: LPS-assembly protein LptD [Firmicutes bacterium]|nr:LPS-assembly protein LptD [Bacillota bacterium]
MPHTTYPRTICNLIIATAITAAALAGAPAATGAPAVAHAAACATAKGEAQLSADVLSFDVGGRIILAWGKVRLAYKDIVIRCGFMKLDLATNELFAEGNVWLQQNDEEVEARSLTYNLKTQKGKLYDAAATITGKEIRGELKVKGSQVEVAKDVINIFNGSLTSCDLDPPHYHIEATGVTIYIDEKVVIRNVSYWEGKLKIFYWPYLVFSLKEENEFELPKIGYSEREGWYIKTTYNYYRNDASRGSIYLDYMERLGAGAGMKHRYDFGKVGEGFIYLYLLGNRITGHPDASAELSHELSLGSDTTARLGVRYEDSLGATGTLNTTLSTSLVIDEKDPAGSANLVLEGTWAHGDYAGQARRGSARVFRRINESLELRCDASYLDNQLPDTPIDRYFNYLVDVRQALPWADARLVVENYVKPKDTGEEDEEPEEDIPWNALRRLPELTVTTRPVSVNALNLKLPVSAGAQWGRYQEKAIHDGWEPSVLSADRTRLWVGAGPVYQPLWKGARASVSFKGTRDSYTTGDRRLTLEAEAGITQELSSWLTLSGSYQYRGIWGWSPFVYDELDPRGLVSLKLQLDKENWGASISAGYDLYTQEADNVVGQVTIRPTRTISLDVEGRYDVEAGAIDQVTARLDAQPREDFKVRLAARFLPSENVLDRLEGDVDVKVAKDWSVKATAVYGGVNERAIKRLDIGVVKDLHCRELALMYNYKSQEIWLEYRIKAFPFEGLKFGLGDQGVLFKPPVAQ